VRIAYLVDIHDRFSAVAQAVSTAGGVDVLLVGGDLTNAGTPEQAEAAIIDWQRIVPQVLAVAGNMDSPAIDERLAELGVSLDGTGVVVGQVGFFGVSAAPLSPLRTPYELDVLTTEVRDAADGGLGFE
jgi:Icc-related predicted phosphoesterase